MRPGISRKDGRGQGWTYRWRRRKMWRRRRGLSCWKTGGPWIGRSWVGEGGEGWIKLGCGRMGDGDGSGVVLGSRYGGTDTPESKPTLAGRAGRVVGGQGTNAWRT